MKVGLVYARVSTAAQAEDGTSLNSQVAACEAYASQHGITILEVIQEDASGASLARPGLDRVRDIAASGIVDTVIVYDPDRLSRDLADMLVVVRELERVNVSVQFVTTPRDDSPTGELMFNVRTVFAAFERKQIIERTRRGKEQRIREGRVINTNRIPYGYKYDRERHNFTIVEREARYIRLIFEWIADEHLLAPLVTRRYHSLYLRRLQSYVSSSSSLPLRRARG